jgi:Zn-finger nucleic acid-binding protein
LKTINGGNGAKQVKRPFMNSNPITCDSCKKTFNSQMRFCPFCGTERQLTYSLEGLACPICHEPFNTISYKDEEVCCCAKCNGLWLNKGEYEKLTSERSAMLDPTISYTYKKGLFEQRTAYLPCPVCRNPMSRINFRKISGIIIDICGDHGAWFDAGELDNIRSFVANSGVTASQDRDILMNTIDIDAMKPKIRDLEMMEKILHRWDARRIFLRGL